MADARVCRTIEQIMLKDRKGFVRVAVEEGVDGGIVPVYHFGNSQVGVKLRTRERAHVGASVRTWEREEEASAGM